jgi:death-on-curing protein
VNEPIFLTPDEVLRIHARSLAEQGSEGVRDPGSVVSALASAKNIFFCAQGDLFEVAAGHAVHVAESQAFVDGIKRTQLLLRGFFLRVMAFRPDRRLGNYARP